MSKRKFKEGKKVVSVAELLEHDWFIVHFGKRVNPVHKGFLASWQLHTCELFVDQGWIYIAERVANYAWEIANVKMITPAPIKRRQGLWEWGHTNNAVT